jgi:molybdopterin-binding protein
MRARAGTRHRYSASGLRRTGWPPVRRPAPAGRRICVTLRKMPMFRIKEAASLLGVSTDTLRRWADAGRITTVTDEAGRMAVDGTALAALAQELAESAGHEQDRVVVAHSARNRFSGLISRVTRDTVMAQVEIQAGPHRFVSLLSREAADELGLEPGMLAVAAVKATNVSVEIPKSG